MSAERPCGLYRTGVPLAGQEEAVPAGVLVYFHNHSEDGPPIVLPPETNSDNRWYFGEEGWLIQDETFLEALVPLRPEGLYVVTESLALAPDNRLGPRTLLQLGYNRRGDPIVFIAQFEGNTILFPARGFRFHNLDVFERIEPANFAVPERAEPRVLH